MLSQVGIHIMGIHGKTKFDEEEGGTRKSLTCCGLCFCSKTQKRLISSVIIIPLLVILSLVLAVLIKAWTAGEKFQLQTLSEDDVLFLNPTQEESKGEYKILLLQLSSLILCFRMDG